KDSNLRSISRRLHLSLTDGIGSTGPVPTNPEESPCMVVSRASGKEEIGASLQSSATWPALFVSSAVANRVSNRVLLAPMMRHTYFLALCTTVVQLAVYGAWLRRRIRRGLVTEPMWSFAKAKPLLLATFGLCEGAFFPLVFYSAARLPGSLVQVLNQTLIPFT
ncbi:unnamed protein product, partial [Effrenium voratum]